jgi:predicted pyridoxine 5'-phosphate oxidase superfamily flavin-nucleotide-binding protein
MAKMTPRIRELFEKVPSAVFATAGLDGQPNAIPVGAKKVLDEDTVLISDQFFNKTRANLEINPRVSITFWDGYEGYQIKGFATIETKGECFEETARWIEDLGNKAGFPLKSKGAVIVKIEAVYAVSPGPGAGRQLA